MVSTHKPTVVKQGVSFLNFITFIIETPNTFFIFLNVFIIDYEKSYANSEIKINGGENICYTF